MKTRLQRKAAETQFTSLFSTPLFALLLFAVSLRGFVALSLRAPFAIPLSAFRIRLVPHSDTREKTVLAKRTHLTAVIHKPKQERNSYGSPVDFPPAARTSAAHEGRRYMQKRVALA